MKEPVDHILRPRLPWRSPDGPAITECGYDASKVKTISRDDFIARTKEYGRQRTALLTCMTCSQASERWSDWDVDPRKAVGREITWESAWGANHGERLKDELRALAELARRHSDEFAQIMSRIDWIRKKEAKP